MRRATFLALALLATACAAPVAEPAARTGEPPPGPQTPPVAALPANPALDARTIVERATAAAGGETWRRPRTLFLEGYAVFYGPGGAPLVNQRHAMWRVFPEFKPDAHGADGKVRIESWRDGRLVTFTAFDGARTYNRDGPVPPSEADRQWAENFGFGVIRFALDPGYTLARLPDDLVDGVPVYRVEVIDPGGARTQFGIGVNDYAVRSVGFVTPRGWHERIYSDFYRLPGISWTQPGRIRLLYNGIKQNEIIWQRFRLNEPMDDALFNTPPGGAP